MRGVDDGLVLDVHTCPGEGERRRERVLSDRFARFYFALGGAPTCSTSPRSSARDYETTEKGEEREAEKKKPKTPTPAFSPSPSLSKQLTYYCNPKIASRGRREKKKEGEKGKREHGTGRGQDDAPDDTERVQVLSAPSGIVYLPICSRKVGIGGSLRREGKERKREKGRKRFRMDGQLCFLYNYYSRALKHYFSNLPI